MPRYRIKGQLTKRNKALAKGKDEDGKKSRVPHSFIIHRGLVGKAVQQLQLDFRRVMEPNTAVKLKERKKNTIKDFVSLSSPMNVSHLVMFSRTDIGIYMKMCRMPRGPSLTFRLENYSLSRDVISSLKKQMTYGSQFAHAPCLMTNLQPSGGDNHLQLVCRMFLDMFPTITPNATKVSSLRRCCLLHYDDETEEFDFRHYSIRIVPVGVSKAVKKLVGNKIPDLGKYTDMSEFLSKAGIMSESEGEDDVSAQVEVDQKLLRKKGAGQKSSVRLVELGPRISMKLIKVQEGLFDGNMLYHKLVHKTKEEKIQLEKSWAKKRKLKEKRTKDQDENVARKKQQKVDHKEKCLAGMKIDRKESDKKSNKAKEDDDDDYSGDVENDEHEDDAKYYLEEVGEMPDEGMFTKPSKRKLKDGVDKFVNKKKSKISDQKPMKKMQSKEKDTCKNKKDEENHFKNKGKKKLTKKNLSNKGKKSSGYKKFKKNRS